MAFILVRVIAKLQFWFWLRKVDSCAKVGSLENILDADFDGSHENNSVYMNVPIICEQYHFMKLESTAFIPWGCLTGTGWVERAKGKPADAGLPGKIAIKQKWLQ